MWDIVRWDPVRDMAAVRAEMDRAMARRLGEGGVAAAPWSPASDVYETDDAIVITAELPGVKDEDVKILRPGRPARHPRGAPAPGRGRHRPLSPARALLRRLRAALPRPPGVNDDDIEASVAYGVLRVSIPKPKAAEPKRIPISSG